MNDLKAKTVLLIEDNAQVLENTAEILELANYKVLTAVNGKQGVQLAMEHIPDLIVCDIMMPELDGYGVLHLLGRDQRTADIPFIFLTARAEKEDYRKGMVMGADDYLTKPFDDVELLNAVQTRLDKFDRIKKSFERSAEGLDQFLSEASGLSGLVANKRVKLLKKKEQLYSEGSYPASLFFLQKGKVKEFRRNDQGKEYITNLYKEGDFFGYLDLLHGDSYQQSAVCLEASEVAVIPKDDFIKLLEGNRAVAAKFIRILSDNIRDREVKLLQLAYNSVRKRVAESLVQLVNRYQQDKSMPFTMAISREDIASMTATATETVIRVLSDFKDERLVDLKGSSITVLDYGRLMKMRN
ncbi:MAG: transcriptional regulator [Dyadobacter sp. 50-39]|uniref:response regulator n=1 Tax=Dyadobacter sp. 50-39 TaxID=1895756 RepID=UPI00095F4323|nr:response regulator [Dyadobacter sp. 50-39]OJV21750.1 MAG: transcriptional regulator [Dyadobacter sp. 50-39]